MKTKPTTKKKYDGPERRQYFRYNLIYAPKDNAKLITGTDVFEVLDLSAEGLRFKNNREAITEKQVCGILEFSSGETRTIEGEVIWEHENEIGLKFISQSRNS